MSDREYVKFLVKEAAVYRSQGLLVESKAKYSEALEFTARSETLCRQKKFIESIEEKMRTVDEDLLGMDHTVRINDLPEDQQGLLKGLFTFSKTKETAAIEGAVALAQFGQYEKALEEFQRLIKEGILPTVAAKHVLRLYLSLSLPDAAVARFTEWASSGLFSKQDLQYIKAFLREGLKKSGAQAQLKVLDRASSKRPRESLSEGEIFTITDISVHLPDGPLKGRRIDFDVIDQQESRISLIIPSDQRGLTDHFETGSRLPDIQYYSPMTVFKGSGVVTRKAKIKEGPSQGDYMVDITVDGH